MGLRDVVEEEMEKQSVEPGRHYPKHEKEEDFWEWFEELEQRFPCEIKCDFIEVSTKMKKYHAKAYWEVNPRKQFIRFAEYYVKGATDEELKKTLLHEMVHLYTYQKGYSSEISDGSHIFKWICGAVGAEINQVRSTSRRWEDLAEPFLEENR